MIRYAMKIKVNMIRLILFFILFILIDRLPAMTFGSRWWQVNFSFSILPEGVVFAFAVLGGFLLTDALREIRLRLIKRRIIVSTNQFFERLVSFSNHFVKVLFILLVWVYIFRLDRFERVGRMNEQMAQCLRRLYHEQK